MDWKYASTIEGNQWFGDQWTAVKEIFSVIYA